MNLRRNVSMKIAAIAITGAVLVPATAAYAFVEFKGNANGQAVQNKTAMNATIDVTVGNVLPGGDSEAVTAKVTNTGNVKIQVRTVDLTLVSVTKAGGGAVTDTAVLNTISLTDPTDVTGASATLDKGANVTRTGSISVTDSDTVDQSDLVGATFVVKASVNN